jgi:hypothetical protein
LPALPPPPRLRTTGPASAAAVKSEDDQPHATSSASAVFSPARTTANGGRAFAQASNQPTVRVLVFLGIGASGPRPPPG